MDGRKFCARSGAAIATVITLTGLELVSAGAASAAQVPPTSDNNNVAAARALADRLASQAAKVGDRHDHVQASLDRVAQAAAHAADRHPAPAPYGAGAEGRGRQPGGGLRRRLRRCVRRRAGCSGSVADRHADVVQPADQRRGRQRGHGRPGPADVQLRRSGSPGSPSARPRWPSRCAPSRRASTPSPRAESQLQQRADDAQARVTDLIGGPAVAYALSKVGDSYVWGATGPSAFDCSGLTMAAWSPGGRLAAALLVGAVQFRTSHLRERAAAR